MSTSCSCGSGVGPALDKKIAMGLPVVDYPKYDEKRAKEMVEEFDNEDLALRCYTSNLIGSAASLVLHGGGNTSVKSTVVDKFGDEKRVLYVKGSGYNLDSIIPKGFPCLDLEHLEKMLKLDGLSDPEMVNEFRTHMFDASSPNPSLETLLHTSIPQKFVDHSHADAIAALADHEMDVAQKLFEEAFGDKIKFALVPYLRPGFGLSGATKKVIDENPGIQAVVLLKHGLFTWGDTAKESYENHILAVNLAEKFIQTAELPKLTPRPFVEPSKLFQHKVITTIRGLFSELSDGKSWIIRRSGNQRCFNFAQSEEVTEYSQIGTITPDHVIRTKPKPLVIRGLEADKFYQDDEIDFSKETPIGDKKLRKFILDAINGYSDQYRNYFDEFNKKSGENKQILDLLPRILLLEHFGLLTIDKSFKACMCTSDIYEHTVPAILSSMATGGKFEPVTPYELWNIEYWELEQMKLKVHAKAGVKSLAGVVAYITGGASGIGLATALLFAKNGATITIVDVNKERIDEAKVLLKKAGVDGLLGVVVDVTNMEQVDDSIHKTISKFGGIDILVSNAGIVVQASPGMASCPDTDLKKSMDVNFYGHQNVSSAIAREMVTQGIGGSLLYNVSKAPLNPGPKLGPYCIAKAATLALMRQYAVEYASHGIRSNAVNADRVMTNLFDLSLVEKRAAARGLTAEQYFKSNLLQTQVESDDVAAAFLSLALAKKTTGGIYTVDGGNIAAAPR